MDVLNRLKEVVGPYEYVYIGEKGGVVKDKRGTFWKWNLSQTGVSIQELEPTLT